MSFDRPMKNSTITSRNPTTLALSMTENGIGCPRTFSVSAQKMWPPSRGRNGNRLTMASEREMMARTTNACATSYLIVCWSASEVPTTPEICLRFSASKIRASADTVPLVTRHIPDTLSDAACSGPTSL
jgi:hypothetical protein